jgi:hypothetical protein
MVVKSLAMAHRTHSLFWGWYEAQTFMKEAPVVFGRVYGSYSSTRSVALKHSCSFKRGNTSNRNRLVEGKHPITKKPNTRIELVHFEKNELENRAVGRRTKGVQGLRTRATGIWPATCQI